MLQAEHIYHIYNRANGSENLFRVEDNYRYFLQQFTLYIKPIAHTYCYCLMPNHFHFMIKIKSISELLQLEKFATFISKQAKQSDSELENTLTPETFLSKELDSQHRLIAKFLSQQFSNLFNSYSKAFNKMFERKGSLFIPRFKYKLIDNSSYYTRVIHYIHANPVHHGFTSNLSDWKWSSYNSYFSSQSTALANDDVLGWFGNMDDFKKAHQLHYEQRFADEFE